MSGELKCTEKINAAKERKDFPKVQIQEVLIKSFKNRITALKEQRENIKSVHNKISNKITDTPISSIMYWD
jgi:type VI protein secretion system component Hcp